MAVNIPAPDAGVPPVDYTSRDWEAVAEQMRALVRARIPDWSGLDPSDFGNVLIEAFAHSLDVAHYYIDRVAAESSIATAALRTSVVALAAQQGYYASNAQSSSLELTFHNRSATPILCPALTVCSAPPTVGGALDSVFFETLDDVLVPAGGDASVGAVEGRTRSGFDGQGAVRISGGEPLQSYRLLDGSVVEGSVRVFVTQGSVTVEWLRVDGFYGYAPNAQVFVARNIGDGSVMLQFGDDVSGHAPPVGSVMQVQYRSGGGVRGNVPAGTGDRSVVSTIVSPPMPQLSVNNFDSPGVGGSDEEPTVSVRRSGAARSLTLDRAVSLHDYQLVALSQIGVGKARASSPSAGAVTVAIAPYDDGTRTPGLVGGVDGHYFSALRATVRSELERVSVAGVNVSVTSPSYVPAHAAVHATLSPTASHLSVREAINRVLEGFFDYSQLDMGEPVWAGPIVANVVSLSGVMDATVALARAAGGPLTDAQPNEIFTLDFLDAPAVTITFTGGVDDLS